MIRSLAALGLTAVLAGCSSGGGQSSSTFSPEPPPTVAPQTGPTSSAPAPDLVPVPTGKTVPAGAMLKPADLGAGWTTAAAEALGCPSPLPAAPSRTAAMKDRRGTLTETVSRTSDVTGAVAAWKKALARCGWSVDDYRLGDAGLMAHGSGKPTVVMTGTEGVLVLLRAGEGLASASDEIDSWADLALGTSCEAAPDGCH